MKIAVSTYSYQRLLSSGAINQMECVAKTREMGADAIEFVDILPHDGSTRKEYAQKLRAECERVGLEISCYTVAADFISGSGGDFDAEVERVKGEVDIAAILGAPCMRHDAAWGPGKYRSFEEALPVMAEGCRRVTEYAALLGIKTTVENHGFFCQNSDRVERLMLAVGHENFGLLCDMGNFLCVDETSVHAVSRLADWALYAHAKDFLAKSGSGDYPGSDFFATRGGNFLRGTVIGHGVVPVRQCLSILKAAGYDGPVGVEFEGMEPVLDGIRAGVENLRMYMESLH